MSSNESLSEEEKRNLLIDYWDTIPLVINVEIPVEEVLTHDVRELIIFYIRKGKEEKDKEQAKAEKKALKAQLKARKKEEKAKQKNETPPNVT